MNANVEIKKVNNDSFPFFVELIKQLALFEKLPPPTKDAIERLKKDCLSNKPKFEAFISYSGNLPVAYMIIFMTYSSFLALPTLYIEDLFIIEEARRQGIGQTLFDYAKKLAQERGCGRMEWSVLEWNTPAIKFYEKNNAKYMKDWLLYRIEF